MSAQAPPDSAYGRWVIRWRWPVLLGSILLALLAGSGAQNLAFNNDYRVFFSDDNPQLQAFEELQRTYTKIDNILFAVEPQEGAVFTPVVLDAIETLTHEAWQLPYMLRVDSISNYQHTEATEDDLIVADLVEGGIDFDSQQLSHAKEIALNEPILRDLLLSGNADMTGVNVTFQMPEKDLDEMPTAVAAARALAAQIEEQYPVRVYLTGMVMLNNSFFEMSMRDMSTLVPLMYLVIIVITFALVRSISATIGTILVILLSLITAMGLAGWAGIELTPPSSAAPTIIMTLAVADSIHILVALLVAVRRGVNKRDAITESMRLNLSPVTLTSLTTAIGFLSLNFSDSPPFADLGNITAMGVVGALVYSALFLPAFLAVMPMRVKQRQTQGGQLMERLGDWVVSRHRPVLLVSAVAAAAMLAFVPTNTLNDDFVGYFDDSTTFRQDVDFTTEHLTGAYQLQYSLPAEGSNGVSDPAFLRQADAFVNWLRNQEEVRHVDSITDTFKRLNKNLHGNDPAYYKLPEERQAAAQFLLLYELSLPYGLDLNNRLNIDKSSTQIVATLENLTSSQLRDIAQRGEGWLDDNAPNLAATGIGPAVMFAYISDRNIRSMLVGTFLAVVLISGILVLALRSLKVGVISLVPNLLPAGLSFGLWGLLVGELNMAVSMVSGMSLGIVVDDTVHFLSKYLRARREQGLDAPDAVRYAFSSVGRAIVITSVILVSGFSVLAQSPFALNSSMALLTAIAIGMALLADFFLLPGLLIRFDRDKAPTGAQSAAA
ncbi:MAG: MMPL family transporter [Candidatus Latescibacteria bacterium]|nr:MMPL family transporter [Candidatus Latescibacterota bacterium]